MILGFGSSGVIGNPCDGDLAAGGVVAVAQAQFE
jgi:hypothetical protein